MRSRLPSRLGDCLGDEDLVDPREIGDPRGEVHGLAVVVSVTPLNNEASRCTLFKTQRPLLAFHRDAK
jgi:hypothetical protein